MFGIAPTPFDLRLVAFRIPIRVHPTFWLGSLLFGMGMPTNQFLFIWVVCSFFSILNHELGHALTAESFGWPTEIVLYFGGGLAISQRGYNNTPGRSIVVSFMGPAAGFLLYGMLLFIEAMLPLFRIRIHDYPYVSFTFGVLEFMNLYWGLLNLIPVLPLDGGQIFQAFAHMIRLRNPMDVTLKVSAVVAGLAAYYFFVYAKAEFVGILMLMLCVQSITALQNQR